MAEDKAVSYSRESSDDTNKAPPIEEQIKKSEQISKENNWELVEHYSDNGFSGGDWNRPDWNRLVKDANFHKFNIVIVFSQDRIARDTEQFLWFYRNLKKSYVKIYSITDGWIDMESVGDRVKHTSLAQASEIFRLITSEKVKKTYQLKKREAERKKIKLDWGRKAKELDVNKIKALRMQGKGYRQIKNEIGGVSYQTIRRVLQKTLPENNSISKENLGKKKQVT